MTQTDIPPSLIMRISQAARYVISGVGPETWFGPLQPLQPMAPADVAGRRFDYPTGYNLTTTPRSYESVSFQDLRALADNCDILRSVIETRKDQMEALDWAVRVTQAAGGHAHAAANDDQKGRIEQITAFLHSPDREHSFSQWLRQLLEDMFVTDAACLYKRRTRTGDLYALEVLDGATIKVLLDDSGRLPFPPDPAYQQILKGVPAADYTRDELMYLVHNPRSHKVYGYSHVEQVLVTVNILIRRALHQLDYYKEGSQPDAFIGLPKEWNQEQIVAFQRHFDAMLAGNLGMRRRLRFMPGDFKYQETKAPLLKDLYDEYLARIICFVFSISPEPFVSHVNRATAESSQSRATDEGLAPLQRYVRGIMNRIIKCEFASPDLEFVWQDTREQDPKDAASIDVAYVGAGILTVNEIRANMGLVPLAEKPAPAPAPQKKTLKLRKRARKYNQYHDERGRFTTADDAVAGGGASSAAARAALAQNGVTLPPAHPASAGTQVAGLTAVEILPMVTVGGLAVATAIAAHNAKPTSPTADEAGSGNGASGDNPPAADSGNNQGTSNQPAVTKPDGIPDDWIEKDADDGGKQWVNPDNTNDRVRVMPGNPDSPYPWQQVPYVIDQNGGFRDVNGNPISGANPGKSPEAHIPRDKFIFRR